ncbi:hypothetical protein [Niveispirillum irakense]|uniref:hypothetical protein n=1 Tax=Niveispirillum irakense TaxID=34011 RepID=UPI00040445F7|nr:hypothetical protein [Niveispirillum irakense]
MLRYRWIVLATGLLVLGLMVQTAMAQRFPGAGPGTAVGVTTRAFSTQARQLLRPELVIRSGRPPAIVGLAGVTGQDRFAILTGDGGIRLWDMRIGAQIQFLRPPPGIDRVALGDGGLWMVLRDDAGTALFWRQTAPADFIPLSLKGVTALTGQPDGPVLVATAQDGLFLLDADGIPQPVSGAPQGVTHLAAAGSGAVLAGAANGAVWHLRVGEGTVQLIDQWRLSGPVAALTADGTGVMLAAAQNGVLTRLSPGGAVAWTLETGQSITSLALAPGGLGFGRAGDATVSFQVDDGRSGPAPTLAGATTGDLLATVRGTILAAGNDGRVTLVDGRTAEGMADIHITATNWAVIDRAGRFDGTAEIARDFAWRLGQRDIDLVAFSEKWFEPGLAARYLSAGIAPLATTPPATPEQGFELPPEVRLSLSDRPASDSDRVMLKVEAIFAQPPANAAVPRLRLRRGERLLDMGALPAPDVSDGGKVFTWQIPAPLAVGENRFAALVAGWGEVEVASPSLTLNREGETAPGRLLFAAMGIDAYGTPALSRLLYSGSDAAHLRDIFAGNGSPMPVYSHPDMVLRDTRTRMVDIHTLFNGMEQARPQDVAIIALVGHGAFYQGQWFFPSSEVRRDDLSDLPTYGLSATQLAEKLSRIQAGRIVLIIDACYSGAVLDVLNAFSQRRLLNRVSQDTGVVILASASSAEQSHQYEGLKMGIFSYILLSGVKADMTGFYPADVSPRDGKVMLRELSDYTRQWVPALAALAMDKTRMMGAGTGTNTMQTPVLAAAGADFQVR